MRTIVALFLCSIAMAQSLADVERLENNVANRPDNVADRSALLQALTNPNVQLPLEKVRELRRQNVLWVIEHHPEAPNFYASPNLLLPASGRLADPAGSAEAAALWKELASRPGATPDVVANAAIYLRAIDATAALAILDGRPEEPAILRARGLVYGAAILGMSGLSASGRFGTSAALRATPEAKQARLAVDSSNNAFVLGSAGRVLSLAGGRVQTEVPSDLTFGDDDPLALAEHWLRRAIALSVPADEWKPILGETLWHQASHAIDPKEKVRLLTESVSLCLDQSKPGVLNSLMIAEFDSGDDVAAERDAQRVLVLSPKAAVYYNAAQTILGRVAAAKGDFMEAKSRLRASITMPAALKYAVIQPNMTLAQDVYDSGDKDAVVEFLESSRSLWKFDRGRIDRMISFVKKAPDVDLVRLVNQFPGSEIVRRAAPDFSATDGTGKDWTREQLAGKVVALEFGSAPLAEKAARDRGAVLLRIQDPDTRRRFEVLTDPTLVVIDRNGNVSGFRSGSATEAEWRTEIEAGFGGGPNPTYLPAPRQVDAGKTAGAKVTLAWEPVENAQSYVVEWDSRDENGWQYDQDHSVRVIATADASATLDLTGFTRIRWRVYAVPKTGSAGKPSPWREIEGVPFTKIYK